MQKNSAFDAIFIGPSRPGVRRQTHALLSLRDFEDKKTAVSGPPFCI
jgi:hypothetical protein